MNILLCQILLQRHQILITFLRCPEYKGIIYCLVFLFLIQTFIHFLHCIESRITSLWIGSDTICIQIEVNTLLFTVYDQFFQ